jgi:hypothetical protein
LEVIVDLIFFDGGWGAAEKWRFLDANQKASRKLV